MDGAPNRPAAGQSGVTSAEPEDTTEQSKPARALESVQEHTREVTAQAAEEARGVVEETVDRVHGEAERQTEQVQQLLARTGSQLDALADGRLEDAGPLPEYARRASTRVNDLADRVERLGFDGIVSEVSGYARRRPGRFLLMSAAAGVVVGRLGRNIRANQQSQGGQGAGQPRPEAGTARAPAQPARGGQGMPSGAGVPPGFGTGPAPGDGGDPLAADRPGLDTPRAPGDGRDD